MTRVLIVEDEESFADPLAFLLRKEGFTAALAATGQEALEEFDRNGADIVLLDLMLPGMSGTDVCKQLRQRSAVPVIMVTARDSEIDKVVGLELGADDYVTKPFHLAELNSRIKSVIRRRKFAGKKENIFNEIHIEPESAQVKVNNRPVILTKKEYELLLFFVSNQNRVLSKESIAEHLWGDNIDSADSFDFIFTHIKNLRKKIVNAGGNDYIKTVYGMGYKFTEHQISV